MPVELTSPLGISVVASDGAAPALLAAGYVKAAPAGRQAGAKSKTKPRTGAKPKPKPKDV